MAKTRAKAKKPTKPKLNKRQTDFVNAYLGEANGCATDAAELAGYKGERPTLAQVGSENLRKPEIQKLIQERLATSPLALSRGRVLALLAECAEGGWGEPQEDQNGEKVVTLTKASDRLKALELFGKYHGLFKDRVEHTGKDGKPIEVQTQQGPDLTRLSPEQLREYKRCMAQAVEALKPKEDDDA